MEASHSNLVLSFFGPLIVHLPALFTIIVSVIYFKASPKSQSLQGRLIASAHGVVITLVFYSTFTFVNLVGSSVSYKKPFIFLTLVPVGFVMASLFIFKGNKNIHFYQVINLLGLVWCYFFGGMAITGLWL